jgi:hypothetical protein
MSPIVEALCCVPVLVLWFGPAAALVALGGSTVWTRLAHR